MTCMLCLGIIICRTDVWNNQFLDGFKQLRESQSVCGLANLGKANGFRRTDRKSNLRSGYAYLFNFVRSIQRRLHTVRGARSHLLPKYKSAKQDYGRVGVKNEVRHQCTNRVGWFKTISENKNLPVENSHRALCRAKCTKGI